MTKRTTASEPGKSDPAVVVFIAAAIAVLLVARWLARLDWPGLAGVAAAVAALLFGWWAVRPKRRLPRNRVRYMRLRLRLHPGPGHAAVFELWLRWGPGAAACRARRARPSLSFRARRLRPSQASVLVGRAQDGRGLRVPAEEHVIFIAPPRTGKSGALAEIIEQYPGPVVVTATRGDLHTLTARSRAAGGPVHVRNPQRLAEVASTMRWDLPAGARTRPPRSAARCRCRRSPPTRARGRTSGRRRSSCGCRRCCMLPRCGAAAWTWCTTGRCPGPRTRSWARWAGRAAKPSGGAR